MFDEYETQSSDYEEFVNKSTEKVGTTRKWMKSVLCKCNYTKETKIQSVFLFSTGREETEINQT